MNSLNKVFNFYNVSVDEDGYVSVEEGKVGNYKWKGFINKDSGSIIEEKDIDEKVEEFLSDGNNEEWFGEEVGEKEKLLKGIENIKEWLVSVGGIVVIWSVEYDWNMCVVSKDLFDEDGECLEEDVCFDDGEEVLEWFNREVDESEF